MNTINVFNNLFNGPVINPNPPLINEYKQLNVMQQESYKFLKTSQYSLISAPTGSGKTLAIENLCYCYLKNKQFKHIVICTVLRNLYNIVRNIIVLFLLH